jgi:hypothetical protein
MGQGLIRFTPLRPRLTIARRRPRAERARDQRAETSQAMDSPVEGEGFEPSVPLANESVFLKKGARRQRGPIGSFEKAVSLVWGTNGSNPSPSASQTVSALNFAAAGEAAQGVGLSSECARVAASAVGREPQGTPISRQAATISL